MKTQDSYSGLTETAAMEAYASRILEAFNAVPNIRGKEELSEMIDRLYAEESLARAAGIGEGEGQYFPNLSTRDLTASGARLHCAMETLRTFLAFILEGDVDDEAMATDNLFTYKGRKWTLGLLGKLSPWIAVAHRRTTGGVSTQMLEDAKSGREVSMENEAWTEYWFDSSGEYGTTEEGHIFVDTAKWPESAWEAIEIEGDFDRLLIARALSKIPNPTDEDVVAILESLGLGEM
jgi:hypothetical protein